MQEVGNPVVSDYENKRAFLCYVKLMKTRYLKVDNVRKRLSLSDGKIPMVGISLKAQTERINGLLEGYAKPLVQTRRTEAVGCCSVLL